MRLDGQNVSNGRYHQRLTLAVSVVHGERVNLVMVSAWLYEPPYCTDSGILLFLLLVTIVLIVSRFG